MINERYATDMQQYQFSDADFEDTDSMAAYFESNA